LQKTIKNKIKINGKGLHTGIESSILITPSEINNGIRFRRVDLPKKPYIHALIENIYKTNRRTVLKQNNAIVETVEHILAAIFVSRIDNLTIEIDGPEIPILDGSSKIFMQKIEDAGVQIQNEKKPQFEILNYFKVENPLDGAKIEFYPQKTLEIEVSIDYGSKVLTKQKAKLDKFTDFKTDISEARTFCFLHELDQLMNHNLIQGGDVNNGVVFIEEDIAVDKLGELKKLLPQNVKKIKKGILNNKKLLYDNEQAKHKLLDLVGDISLAGFEIKGKIVAHKPGHTINALFTEKLKRQIIKKTNIMNEKPLMGINAIKKILPHREPFLFIDEIRELEDNHVTGVKYVHVDEYYFKGHFPNAPVMPGVLQIEAMAQTGGILALNSVPDPENYLTYFMKIDKVKFKQKVEPNCTLIFKLHLLSPIRRGICHMKAIAYVNNEIVTEAELMAKIVKEK
tara:strand:- start:135 stop:1496 length:1362 start_codon:yes stop_codon:yes gene_type:complete